MMKSIHLTCLFLLIVFATSCASNYVSPKDFDSLSLNMDKATAQAKMSAPGVARGAMINKYGQAIEVREYTITSYPTEIIYWLYFCDGKLVRWGRAGDWAEAQKIVYDINFKTSSG